MPDVLYVGLQEDDKIVSFDIDAGSGKLVPSGETPAAGAPSVFAVSPDRRVLYVGYRGTPAIESCRIDSSSGALTSLGRVATEHPPTYLATDRTGTYLLSAHYQGGYAAVHPLGDTGVVALRVFVPQALVGERVAESREERAIVREYVGVVERDDPALRPGEHVAK